MELASKTFFNSALTQRKERGKKRKEWWMFRKWWERHPHYILDRFNALRYQYNTHKTL